MQGTLKFSSNRGRYSVVNSAGTEGRELSSGCYREVFLGDQWIVGSVEHGRVYTTRDFVGSGYYFIARNGDVCDLCTGMLVRTEHNVQEDEWYEEYRSVSSGMIGAFPSTMLILRGRRQSTNLI